MEREMKALLKGTMKPNGKPTPTRRERWTDAINRDDKFWDQRLKDQQERNKKAVDNYKKTFKK